MHVRQLGIMMLKKVSVAGKVCFKIIDVLFIILILAILYSTLLLDNHVGNPFPNLVTYSNGGFYFTAFLLLCGIVYILVKINRMHMMTKTFYIVVGIVAFVTLIAQTTVAFWIPEGYTNEFRVIHDMAIKLSQRNYVWEDYFLINPNNVHITILISWIYGIADNWCLVVWVGAVLANLSAVFAALTVYQITGNGGGCIVVLMIAEGLVGMSCRSFFVYTDNYGMLFTIVMLWIYVSNIKKEYKGPLILIFGLVGAWIKITVLIPLIAIGVCALLKILITESFNNKKEIIISFILCFLIVVTGYGINKFVVDKYEYEQSESALGMRFYLMMGQDESGLGTVRGEQYAQIFQDICDNYSERNEIENACLRVALDWIKERGIWGNIKYYLKKIDVAYIDGYFHHLEPYDKSTVSKNLIYDLYVRDGKYFFLRADIMQVLWDLVLLLISFDIVICILKKQKEVFSVFKITILGITLYLMLFEDRSKYLFMFLNIYIAYAGLMLNELLMEIRQIYNIYKPNKCSCQKEEETII